MPRSIPTFLTTYDVRRICAEAVGYTDNTFNVQLRPAFDRTLTGREISFTLDSGETLTYRFDRERIEWSDGGAFHEEYAECFRSPREGVYFLHHLKTDKVPYGAASVVIDLPAGSVTYVDMKLGNIKSNRDVDRQVKFGTIGGGVCAHSLTDEFTGVVMDWKYADDAMIHEMYENRSCCAFVSPPPVRAYEWADYFTTWNPTKYVRLQDQLYLITFYAPGASGAAVTKLMDLRTMTCIGSFFGIDNRDALRSYTFGGKGAYAPVGFFGHYVVE